MRTGRAGAPVEGRVSLQGSGRRSSRSAIPPTSSLLRPKVEHLAHQYEQALDHATQDPDAAFMVASLHHLLRNTQKAHHAIERAIRDGDHSVSAKNLRQMIEKEAAATATYASGSDRAPVE